MSRGTLKINGHGYAAGVEHISTVTVSGIRVPIIRGPLTLLPELRDDDGTVLDGQFVDNRPAIFIRSGQSMTKERDAINHEILHALLLYSGAGEFLRGELRSSSRAGSVEETFVRIVTPHLPAIEWVK